MKNRTITPAAIATWRFGKEAVEVSGEILRSGGSAIDAVEKGINVTELDTREQSVGFGGRPNIDGLVELDAAIMVGRTHDAGSVAGMKGIKTPISVARKVMEESKHAMLVGDGATAFALQHGFVIENLLTDEAKAKWIEHRENRKKPIDTHDTIGLVAIDQNGDLVSGCSTSGFAYKLPGRVGDSPLIGSGLYADNEVGGAAATGLGEEILKFCASFLVVEYMRNWCSPIEACQKVIDRILATKPQNRNVDISVIAMNRKGEFGAGSTRKNFDYAIWTPEICELRLWENRSSK